MMKGIAAFLVVVFVGQCRSQTTESLDCNQRVAGLLDCTIALVRKLCVSLVWYKVPWTGMGWSEVCQRFAGTI